MASNAYSQHSEDNICLNSPPDAWKPEQQDDEAKLPTFLDVAGDEIPATEKPVMSKRIWSREDEKEILKALADFVDETGLRPYKDVHAFNDFLKKSKPQCVEISTRQLKGKIRRMMKKFVKSKSMFKFDFETIQLAHKVWAAAARPVAEEEKKVLECECECEKMFAHVKDGGEVEEAAALPSDGTVAKRMEPVSEQTLAIMEPLEMI